MKLSALLLIVSGTLLVPGSRPPIAPPARVLSCTQALAMAADTSAHMLTIHLARTPLYPDSAGNYDVPDFPGVLICSYFPAGTP